MGWGKKGGWACVFLICSALSADPKACEAVLRTPGIRAPSPSSFLKDAARHLTGNEADAEAVYRAYKKRVGAHDPKLPYPPQTPAIAIAHDLKDLWKDLGLDAEVFDAPLTHKWQTSKSGHWMRRLIRKSGVKGKPRLILRRRTQSGKPLISIAQTWESTDPGASNTRETEVAIARKIPGDWDFAVYDKDGKLTGESTFFANGGKDITGPAPVTCLTCHYNRRTRRFTNIPASFVFADSLVDEKD